MLLVAGGPHVQRPHWSCGFEQSLSGSLNVADVTLSCINASHFFYNYCSNLTNLSLDTMADAAAYIKSILTISYDSLA